MKNVVKKYNLIFILITICFVKFSFEENRSNVCGSDGRKVCASDNTCCLDEKSDLGYKCFPVKSGSCCRVTEKLLLTACPVLSKCDEKQNKCVSSTIIDDS